MGAGSTRARNRQPRHIEKITDNELFNISVCLGFLFIDYFDNVEVRNNGKEKNSSTENRESRS